MSEWKLVQFENAYDEFVEQCDEKMQAKIDRFFLNVQNGRKLDEPHSKKIEGSEKLFRFRVDTIRFIFCYLPNKRICILSGYFKKGKKIPNVEQAELNRKIAINNERIYVVTN